MKVLIKEDFNDTMINLRDKVKNTYDYLKGDRSNNLGTLYDASSAEIKSNATLYKLTQEFDKSKAPYRVQFDKMGKKLLFTFNASKVPTDLVDQFKPNGKYGKKVNSYDPSSKSVEMIFDAAPSKLPKTDRALYKDAKDNAVRAGNGNKSTNESLEEDLTMTLPEPYYSEDRDEFYLKVGINGSTYDFKMKDDSPYSIDQMLNKVIKMMNYSSGKALAFMKKNMIGVKSDKMSIKESNDYSTYEEIDSKEVMDSDGFYTEYTLYTNGENFICIFGDRDLYTPEDTEPDFETENEKEAREWFDNYEGFEDEDDLYYDDSLNESEKGDEEEGSKIFFPTPGGTPEYAKYKYDRRHGDKDVFKSKDYAIKNKDQKDDKVESVHPSDLLELKSVRYQSLKNKLVKELTKILKSPEFGFEDDEIREYSGVEIKEDEGQVYVSVWAEVGFDALWNIKDALDPIIAKYDKDAYFDMEDAGRLLAVISDSKLKESHSNPFKSHHICKGCGKPLDQCTCEIKEEDVDLDSLDELNKVQISRDDFARMCRENSILQGLSSRDYEEIRDSFNIGYEDFDAAVNDLWNSDDQYDREWYVNLLRKYTNSIKKSADSESLKESLNLNEAKNIINVLNKNLRVRFKHSAGGIFSLDRTPFNTDIFDELIKNNYKMIGDILEEQGLKYDISEDAYISKDTNLYVTIYGDTNGIIVQFDEMESESLKESVNSDIVSMIKKQFPEATVKTSVRKHSDVHKSNPDTPVGKTKYVDIRISSVNSILQYCNHNIKKVLDSDSRFDYYGDVPARNPRGSKEVILSYQDYSDLSDDEYKSLLGESLNEDTQLKFDDDMINDIEVLYMWRPEEVERILIKHGSDKNNDNWIDGLDLPAAYDEIMSTFKDKYSDDDEIDYDVAKVLGLVEESSSIGQRKVDSIDLLEPKESLNLDSDGKRLKKLISQLVLDSDEELRDYVNKIIDEVIEERNGGSDDE